jgi:hypothetical protein
MYKSVLGKIYEFLKDLNTKIHDEQESTTLQNELPNDCNVLKISIHLKISF